jgi:hypothetical protein
VTPPDHGQTCEPFQSRLGAEAEALQIAPAVLDAVGAMTLDANLGDVLCALVAVCSSACSAPSTSILM